MAIYLACDSAKKWKKKETKKKPMGSKTLQARYVAKYVSVHTVGVLHVSHMPSRAQTPWYSHFQCVPNNPSQHQKPFTSSHLVDNGLTGCYIIKKGRKQKAPDDSAAPNPVE
jgi:hypothetical protein